MEQLSPSLRTRIYVIAGLGAAGIVLDIVMNASLLDLRLASLAEGLLNLGTSPSRYFVEFFGFLCAALLPLFLFRDQGAPPVLPADDQ